MASRPASAALPSSQAPTSRESPDDLARGRATLPTPSPKQSLCATPAASVSRSRQRARASRGRSTSPPATTTPSASNPIPTSGNRPDSPFASAPPPVAGIPDTAELSTNATDRRVLLPT